MNRLLLLSLLFSLFFRSNAFGGEKEIAPEHFNRVIFEDEFEHLTLKKAWGMYKSASTVRAGVMVGITPDDADHPSVNTIRIEPQGDLEVSVAFKFAGSKRFSIMYRDRNHKGTHAGHICHVAITDKNLTMYDTKFGIFKHGIHEKRKAGTLDQAGKELLKTKQVQVQLDLDTAKWHTLLIRIQGDVMETFIDGKRVGRFQSEGFAHTTKDQVNITTSKKEILYDHFWIKGVE